VKGVKLWVWSLSALSFFLLYPATFNLLEIAAIAKPEIHLCETGIIRICRQTLSWQEFLRPSYLGVTGFIFLLWWGHPWLMQVTAKAPW
jgi:uncharacterized membrane protein